MTTDKTMNAATDKRILKHPYQGFPVPWIQNSMFRTELCHAGFSLRPSREPLVSIRGKMPQGFAQTWELNILRGLPSSEWRIYRLQFLDEINNVFPVTLVEQSARDGQILHTHLWSGRYPHKMESDSIIQFLVRNEDGHYLSTPEGASHLMLNGLISAMALTSHTCQIGAIADNPYDTRPNGAMAWQTPYQFTQFRVLDVLDEPVGISQGDGVRAVDGRFYPAGHVVQSLSECNTLATITAIMASQEIK